MPCWSRTLAVPVTDASGRVQAAMSTAAVRARISLEEMLGTYVPGLKEQSDRPRSDAVRPGYGATANG
jgi:DNA-binding IclR family transcriptional regulator